MARPEKPLKEGCPKRIFFADALRDLKRNAEITYRELAPKANFSASYLSRNANGTRIPPWPVVEAYVLGCDGDLEFFDRLYRSTFGERR